ncbi:MAG: hypothetical protein PF505_06830 [Vallitaleaceae bacterium]|nr:hypothetical protein [Vallitaleaceae bacterium]
MKYKIMDQETIYLAGVVHYGPLLEGDYHSKKAEYHKKYNFENDKVFQKNVDDLRRNASELGNQIKEDIKNNVNGWHDKHKDGDFRDDVDEAIDRLRDMMKSMGKHIENNSQNWEANIKGWGSSFESNMEGFGEKMSAWGESIREKMPIFGESSKGNNDNKSEENNQASNIKRHGIYRTYKEIYQKHIEEHIDHINRNTFYEVQVLDTSFEHATTLVMLGGRMAALDQMRYPVATMTFEPYKWVDVKLTASEYGKDWLGNLERSEKLKDYTFEPYFIVKHRDKGISDEVHLICPISEKIDER